MVTRSRIELQAGNIGDSVAQGRPSQHPRCRHRHEWKRPLHHCHTTLELTSCCCQQLLKYSDINNDKHVSLREDLKCTAAGGQGFVKCNCAALQKKCNNLKCKCFKAQLK